MPTHNDLSAAEYCKLHRFDVPAKNQEEAMRLHKLLCSKSSFDWSLEDEKAYAEIFMLEINSPSRTFLTLSIIRHLQRHK